MENSWQKYSARRVAELTEGGMSPQEAMKQAGKEWKSRKSGAPKPKRGASMASKKSGLSIEYITNTAGTLSEEQASDIALGLLDGLLFHADAETGTELRTMQIRAAELFRGKEKSVSDTAERQFGHDLAEYLVLAVIDRGVDWSELSPAVLGEGPARPVMVTGGTSGRTTPTPEEELGIKKKEERKELGRKVGNTAIDEMVKALKDIMNS